MDNEERAHLEAQHRKELGSLRKEVIRLTILLKQALRSKLEEAKFITQPEHMLAYPHNLRANEVSFGSQSAIYS
jgi:hypothetical protein